MRKFAAFVVREIREALPATLFFLFLFHMIALTKAVFLDDYSLGTIRGVGATVGALIVAKAILVVDALPIARRVPGRRLAQVFGKTLLYGVVVLLFKAAEELVHQVSEHGGFAAGVEALGRSISWPFAAVLALWVVGGLFVYCLAAELTRVVGEERIREILLDRPAVGVAE